MEGRLASGPHPRHECRPFRPGGPLRRRRLQVRRPQTEDRAHPRDECTGVARVVRDRVRDLAREEASRQITILSAVQTDRELEKERGYSARLAEMCRTHGVGFEEKFVKARNIVDTVVEEAKSYDLLALGASTEWRLTQFAFGPWQDQIARRTET